MFCSRMKKLGTAFVAIFTTAFLVYACGGGGSSSGGNAGTTAPADSKTAAAGTKTVISGLDAAGLAGTVSAGLGKPSRKSESEVQNNAKSIRKGLENLKVRFQGQTRRKTSRAVSQNDLSTFFCNLSGSAIESTDDKNTPNDPLDDTITTTYTDCRSGGSGFEFVSNGVIVDAFSGAGFTSTFTNYEEKNFDTTLSASNPVGVFRINGTMTSNGGLVDCGSGQNATVFFSNALFTLNVTSDDKIDDNADGTPEVHEIFTGTNLAMTINESFNAGTCTPTGSSITLNGGSTFADQLSAADNFSATFTNYAVTTTPSARNGVAGDEMTSTGTIAIDSACVDGTYTVTTPTTLFIPEDQSCPIEGKLLFTGGGATVAVISSPGGGIDIDEGDNGSIEKTFANCEDANVCS